jgi:hypothetical protein
MFLGNLSIFLTTAGLCFTASDGIHGRELWTVPPSAPPVADAAGPYIADEGAMFTLDASASSDPDEPTASLTVQWDLDYDVATFDVDAVGVAPSVSFADDFACRTIALRVTDSAGESDIATTQDALNLAKQGKLSITSEETVSDTVSALAGIIPRNGSTHAVRCGVGGHKVGRPCNATQARFVCHTFAA